MKENTTKILCIVFALLTCVVMITSILLFPTLKIKKVSLGTYWIVVLIGAIIVVATSGIKVKKIWDKLTEDTSMNPLKILALFISMTIISVYIDEMGFFAFLANKVLKKAKTSQKKLFVYLFLIVSVLTIFTSNDVIILAFTPFICYFSKNAGISPMPYLISEFVAANSWSMTLIIGNPTNIYLGSANDINFVKYLKVMIVPTISAGLTAFCALYLTNRKLLSMPIKGKAENQKEIKISKPELIQNNSNQLDVNEMSAKKLEINEINDNQPEENDTKVKKEVKLIDKKPSEIELKDKNPEEELKDKNLEGNVINKDNSEVIEIYAKKSGENKGIKLEENKNEISKEKNDDEEIKDKILLIGGVTILVICVILLAISSYIGLEMWIATLVCAGCLFIFVLITSAFKKRCPVELGKTLLRAPWELIPFVLGMFIIIVVIQDLGITESIGKFFGEDLSVIKYGAFAFIACNIINNIPMSVLFSAIMEYLKNEGSKQPLRKAIYSTVAASNIGAFFTPIGALAGIMFTSILTKFEIKFSYLDFLKMGIFIALPTIIVTLVVIYLMLLAL